MGFKKDQSKMTVMIIPHGKAQTHSFQLPHQFFKGLLIVLAIVGVGLLYSIFDYVRLQYQSSQLLNERDDMQAQINGLQKELQKERAELMTLVGEVEEMQEYLEQLEQLETEILNKAGSISLPTSLPNQGALQLPASLGIGGPDHLSTTSWEPNFTGNPAIMREQTAQTLTLLSTKIPDTVKKVTDLRDKVDEINERMAHTPSIYPAIGVITSRFGYRRDPFHGRTRYHDGFDIASHFGAPIYATAAGKVVFAERNNGYGQMIKIAHSHTLHSSYSHLSKMIVAVGDKVEKGQVIGYMGSTGRSTGVHVHYMVYENGVPVDPEQYLP